MDFIPKVAKIFPQNTFHLDSKLTDPQQNTSAIPQQSYTTLRKCIEYLPSNVRNKLTFSPSICCQCQLYFYRFQHNTAIAAPRMLCWTILRGNFVRVVAAYASNAVARGAHRERNSRSSSSSMPARCRGSIARASSLPQNAYSYLNRER